MSKTMKTYAIGDIHGRKEALEQCLERANFDFDNDKLIVLGDIVDGGWNTAQVIEILLKIKNLIFILGNHDKWFIDHLASGWSEAIWLHQGGVNTLKSYGAEILKEPRRIGQEYELDFSKFNVPESHKKFFNKAKYYHIENEMLFVHGGFDYYSGIEETSTHTMLWDRDMIQEAQFRPIKEFKKIFVGHTDIGMIPDKRNNVWCLDTGAGWEGKLCIMNVDTEEYWLSDKQERSAR